MNIEKRVREYLKRKLNIPVYLEEPEEKVTKYAIVEKVGSSVENLIYGAMINVTCYDSSLSLTAALNDQIVDCMDQMPEEDFKIYDCFLNSEYNATETSTHRYRYESLFDITYER
jgi:hypothetical protein